MLTFNLKKEWFEKIKNGEKTHEYREIKPYWTTRFINKLCVPAKNLDNYIAPCDATITFINGYSNAPKDKLLAQLFSIKKINGKNTDLATDKDVYDIEFELIKESECK